MLTIDSSRSVFSVASHAVAEWLASRGHKSVSPVVVKIGKEEFSGAMYEDHVFGGGFNRLYLLGEVPACYRRSQSILFKSGNAILSGCGGYTPFVHRHWGEANFVSRFGGGSLREGMPFGYNFDLTEMRNPDQMSLLTRNGNPRREVSVRIFSANG